MVLVGPLITTLGLALTIPISMICDSIFEGKQFTQLYCVGTLLIAASFMGLNWETDDSADKPKVDEGKKDK